MLVHDASIVGRHRVQLNRFAELDRFVRRLVGLLTKRYLAPLTVSVGIDDHPRRALAGLEHDPASQMLDRIDRLASLADQRTDLFALETSHYRLVGLLHRNLDVEPAALRNHIQQLDQHRLRVLLPTHRLLPERFLRLRGGGGGAAPPDDTAAIAGSSVRSGLPFGARSPPATGGGPTRRRMMYC